MDEYVDRPTRRSNDGFGSLNSFNKGDEMVIDIDVLKQLPFWRMIWGTLNSPSNSLTSASTFWTGIGI
jgi:hypothetical protein